MTTQAHVVPAPVEAPDPPWQVVSDGRGRADPGAPPGLRRTLLAVVCASALALLALLAVTSYAGRRAAEAEALRDARALTELLAVAVVAPAVDDGVLRGDPAALRRLDDLVRAQVLVEPVVRVKVWTSQGRVAYSDEDELIGHVYPLDATERAALRGGRTSSGLARLGEAEHRLDGLRDKVLEVYTPVRARNGQLLLVETYSRFSLVTSRQAEVLRTFLPITVGALVLLQLCQLPLAWSMVRRLRAGQQEREHLLQRAIEASDEERRRIAGDLHDTVVQGLVGMTYVLAAASERVRRGDPTGVEADLAESVGHLRGSVRGLRSMLLEIYPAHVARAGLSGALEDLVAPLQMKGVRVDVHTPAALVLRPDLEALVFRTAQEALRNVARHSRARSASLRLEAVDGGVALTVSDDGVGFDVQEVLGRSDGHVGLRVLQDLSRKAGCLLSVSTAPGAGTRLRLVVPQP